jgi:hypothetical protein
MIEKTLSESKIKLSSTIQKNKGQEKYQAIRAMNSLRAKPIKRCLAVTRFIHLVLMPLEH